MMSIKTEDVFRLMKRCQIGVGGRNSLDAAHDIMSECYGTLGALIQERDTLRSRKEETERENAELKRQLDAIAVEMLPPAVFLRVAGWLREDPPRKATTAFTAGIERQIAYLLESDTLPLLKQLRTQLAEAELRNTRMREYVEADVVVVNDDDIGARKAWQKALLSEWTMATGGADPASKERRSTDERKEGLSCLPCPFCGSEAITVEEGSSFRWRLAVCNTCGAQAGEVRYNTLTEDRQAALFESDVAAIREWNTRYQGRECSELGATAGLAGHRG